MVVALPQAVDVTEFALDPGEGCGDDADVGDARLPRRDLDRRRGGPWTVAVDGRLRPAPTAALNPSRRRPPACARSA